MHDANNFSLELLDKHREPLTGPTGDVQSGAFKITIGINPLIAAAMPLLAFSSDTAQWADDWQSVSATLQHEMKAFETAVHQQGYHTQIILAARYLLCAMLDEFIENAYPHSDWQNYRLLDFFQHESNGSERFFTILKYCCKEPRVYIDLLELGYICLSLGFKGIYRDPCQLRELGLFSDQLYQIIEQQRGEGQSALKPARPIKSTRWRLPPWWVMAAGCCMILSMVFVPYTHQLNKTLKPLIYNINHYEP